MGDTAIGLFANEDFIKRFGEPNSFDLPSAAVLAGFDRENMPEVDPTNETNLGII